MKNNTLVFSIALNGHQFLYRNHIKSHKKYALQHGFHYVAITRPAITKLGRECAWLKIDLIIRALRNGYEWVLFLDADTRININCPSFTQLEQNNKFIYAANGFSGRINSGVLAIKNHTSMLELFEKVRQSMDKPIPKEDDVGWGENGHLIYHLKNNHHVCIIDKKWNNNTDPDLNDFITHFSAGPLRSHFKVSTIDYGLFMLYQAFTAIVMFFSNSLFLSKKSATTTQLLNKVNYFYPKF